MLDIFLSNGRAVTSEGVLKAGIGIGNGKISYIGSAQKKARRIIDASGKYIFPGVIDPHVHFGLEAYGAKTCDDYFSASVNGAAGGVTAFIDFAIPKSKKSSLRREVSRKVKLASKTSALDFSFHPQLIGWNTKIISDTEFLLKNGFPTFKIFMPLTEGWGVTDGEIEKALRFVSSHGGAVEFHAEDGGLLESHLSALVSSGRTDPRYFHMSGPDVCEEAAVKKLVNLAVKSGGRAYVCHLTSRKGLLAALADRKKCGMRVETCPHYLFLNDGVFKKKNGFLYCCNPVLKKKSDNDALLDALGKGIDWLGTDHCAFSYADKSRNKNNFLKVPRGLPGIGMSFPLLFTHMGSSAKNFRKIASLTSINPARYFGMNQKGGLKKGKDADLFMVDPAKEKTVGKDPVYGWSPYEGKKLRGFSDLTVRRGRVIYKKGKLLARRGSGALVFRQLEDL